MYKYLLSEQIGEFINPLRVSSALQVSLLSQWPGDDIPLLEICILRFLQFIMHTCTLLERTTFFYSFDGIVIGYA